MKLLVVGIDGGDKRIVDSMDMPRLQAILKEGICLDITEDLWSRGWTEILCGTHSRETGAFYSKPKLDGSHNFMQGFGIDAYKNNQSIVPIWTWLSEQGYKVGFMNIPTTMPAPEVNGFFVSGAGGGVGKIEAIPPDVCFPEQIKNELIKLDYILDTRFVSSGIRKADIFLERLQKMQKKRTDAFISLCKKYSPKFGFLAYMGNTRIQYLAMSEIEPLVGNMRSHQNNFQRGILDLYKCLDESIGLMIDELQPEHVMIVSDHGAAPYLHSVNANDFLVKINMQRQIQTAKRTSQSFLRTFARFVPSVIKQGIKKTVPQVDAITVRSNIDWDKTVAFGARYVSGIYINDWERFKGPVSDEKAADTLSQSIVDEFNATKEAKKNNLSARLYRKFHKNSKCSALLPDVWIDHPDTVFFEGHGRFVSPNKAYGPIKTLRNINRDIYTGVKGEKPIFCIDNKMSRYIKKNDTKDLTVVYKMIQRVMSS